MTNKSHIGDVVVHKGMPPGGNPYRADGLIGHARLIALLEFHDNGKHEDCTFWNAPCSGGARQITRDEVEWNSCGVEDLRRKVGEIRRMGWYNVN